MIHLTSPCLFPHCEVGDNYSANLMQLLQKFNYMFSVQCLRRLAPLSCDLSSLHNPPCSAHPTLGLMFCSCCLKIPHNFLLFLIIVTMHMSRGDTYNMHGGFVACCCISMYRSLVMPHEHRIPGDSKAWELSGLKASTRWVRYVYDWLRESADSARCPSFWFKTEFSSKAERSQ